MFKRLVIFALALITFSAAVAAQNVDKPIPIPQIAPSLKALPKDSVYSDPGKTFSVWMPLKPKDISSTDPPDPVKVSPKTQYRWDVAEGYFAVTEAKYVQRNFDGEGEVDKQLATAKEIFGKDPEMKFVAEKPAARGKWRGAELTYLSRGQIKTIILILAAGKKAYTVTATVNHLEPDAEAWIRKAVDSFTLLESAPSAADFKDLPQTPVVKRDTADAQDMHLKGKVKMMSVKHFDGAGERMWTEESHFNENGNLVRVLFYDVIGKISSINYFGYVNGSRVSLKVPANDNDFKTPAPGFDRTYKYLYGAGRMQKMTEIEPGGNEIVTLYLTDSHGSFARDYTDPARKYRSVINELFDKDGNLRRKTFQQYDPEGSPVLPKEIYDFNYTAFDAGGNWTSLIVNATVEFRKTSSTYKYSETREIVYY